MKHLAHSTGFRWLHFQTDGLGSVITVVTLRRMAVEFLGLFSPLYVFGLAQKGGGSFKFSVLAVIGYILLIYLFKLLTMPLAENASFKFGYRRTLVISMVPFFLFVGLLALSQNYPFLIILVAIFWGIHASFFWFGFHGLFVKRADQDHFGQQTGLCQSLYISIGVVTPIIGGLVILNFGYPALFLLSGAIFTLAMMVILLSQEIKPQRDARISKVLRLFKKHKRPFAAYFGWGLESALYGAIWPVFLFLLVGEILSFGGIISAAVLMAAIITYIVGVIVDRAGIKDMISFGSVISFLSWIARAIVRTPLLIVGVDGFYRLAEQMIHIPLNVLSYQKAISGGTGRALYFREISLCVGSIIGLTIAILIVFLGLPLWSVFLLASLGSLAPIFSARE